MIKFPGFRRELILDIHALANIPYQKTKWAKNQYIEPFWSHLEIAAQVIFDEAKLNEFPEKPIGDILRNQIELDALKPLIKALYGTLHIIDIKHPDQLTLNHQSGQTLL